MRWGRGWRAAVCSSEDDLGTETTEEVRDSRREKAATRHTAAGHNKRRQNTDKVEHRKGRDRIWRTQEGEVGRHADDRHTTVKIDDSEPHVAAHTTATAHMTKRGEKHNHVNEDEDEDGRRRRTRRGCDRETATIPNAAQPSACSNAASFSCHSCELLDNIPDKDPG